MGPQHYVKSWSNTLNCLIISFMCTEFVKSVLLLLLFINFFKIHCLIINNKKFNLS